MKILICNDDGYLAPGLKVLADKVSTIAEVTVIAPDKNRSGSSNSLTLDYPIRASVGENGYTKVDGTPTDCVHLAITGLMEKEPDMVIAGINPGANMGDDVLYSGTVAAATEGRFLGFPAMAVSIDSYDPKHYDAAAEVVLKIYHHLQKQPLQGELILNINIPDVALDELKGIQVTRLGHRHKAEPVIREKDPRGRSIYWVGPVGQLQDAGEGTDFYAVNNNYVSVTPLHIDLTNYSGMQSLQNCLAL